MKSNMSMSKPTLHLTKSPVAETGMLIRKPVAEVFEAFIDPAITTKFWFTKSSGKLEPGVSVRWDWEMYGVATHARVLAFEQDKRLLIEWGSEGEEPTTVEWKFTPCKKMETFVNIVNSGFRGTGDEVMSQALDSTGGFTLVLAGLKAFLEHDINLNLVADRFPEGTD